MPPKKIKLSDYEIVDRIGFGAFGNCMKVTRKSDKKLFCWKEIDYRDMTDRELQYICDEVNILKDIENPHIVQYSGRIVDKGNQTLYIIMEYCSGGDLANLIKQRRLNKNGFSEQFIWKTFCQMLFALNECHSKELGGEVVLHRDIKPANILLTSNHDIKLGDFGLAKSLASYSKMARTTVGTPLYMSPEIIKGKPYNCKSDVWALGCTIYEMCALAPPFMPDDKLENRILKGTYAKIPSEYSAELSKMISRMLTVDPISRPTTAEILLLKGMESKLKQNGFALEKFPRPVLHQVKSPRPGIRGQRSPRPGMAEMNGNKR